MCLFEMGLAVRKREETESLKSEEKKRQKKKMREREMKLAMLCHEATKWHDSNSRLSKETTMS